jgi:hypothetical protein
LCLIYLRIQASCIVGNSHITAALLSVIFVYKISKLIEGGSRSICGSSGIT